MDKQAAISEAGYKPLPAEAARISIQTSTSPRLLAHLVLVHDTALKLVERLDGAFPGVEFDRDAILFGAATHDIGKTVYSEELSVSGKNHEKAGLDLLRKLEVSEERARFAYTHGNWDKAENVSLEDLVVALADNCWKGKRVDALENRMVETLSQATGKPEWELLLRARRDSRIAGTGSGRAVGMAGELQNLNSHKPAKPGLSLTPARPWAQTPASAP
jgi:putative nucleotidyltransferase with HDIG domain